MDAYPCGRYIVDYMRYSNTELSKNLNSIFGTHQKKMDITFIAKDMSGTPYYAYIAAGPLDNAKIYLSTYILQNSTQDYLLATMYHEYWHAFLDLQRSKLGVSRFNSQYPEVKVYASSDGNKYTLYSDAQHGRFSSFIGLIKDELRIFNPNLDEATLEALATDGLLENRSDALKLTTQNERDSTPGNYKGKKCAN